MGAQRETHRERNRIVVSVCERERGKRRGKSENKTLDVFLFDRKGRGRKV